MDRKTLLRASFIVASVGVVLVGIGAPKLRRNTLDTKVAGEAVELYCAPDATRTFTDYSPYVCVLDKRGKAVNLNKVYTTFAAASFDTSSNSQIKFTDSAADPKVPAEIMDNLLQMYRKY